MTNKLFLIGVLCTIVLLTGAVLTLGGNPHGGTVLVIGAVGALITMKVAEED